jgi:hypothetical protein
MCRIDEPTYDKSLLTEEKILELRQLRPDFVSGMQAEAECVGR